MQYSALLYFFYSKYTWQLVTEQLLEVYIIVLQNDFQIATGQLRNNIAQTKILALVGPHNVPGENLSKELRKTCQ